MGGDDAASAALSDVRKQVVETGYDTLAGDYLAWSTQVEGDPRDRFLQQLTRRLPDGACVLDLGCGAGLPSTQRLAERFEVVGVDLSEGQLRLAREHVPEAGFVRADLAEVAFHPASFAGITAFYSITHVPREEHAALFRSVAQWLQPGGLFLATLSAARGPDWTGEWLGVPMFFSGHDAETNRRLLQSAGFELVLDEVVEMREPEGTVSFLWVLARKEQTDALSGECSTSLTSTP